jgi:ABC-2 type transport system permease protein
MSTPSADASGPARSAGSGTTFLRDVVVNARRWGLKAIRNRFFLVGTLVQPIVFFVLFTQIFGGVATEAIQRGGGSTSYETFLMPAIAIQVALATGAGSGIGLVNDMETGMFEKVLVSPMHRSAVFLGKSAAEVGLVAVQILLIVGVGWLFGARIETGIAGAIGVVLIGILFSIWFTAYSNVIAVLTRDQESTILAANLLQFPLLFVSSAFIPLDTMPEWIQTLAKLNPVTYGVDAARAFVLGEDVLQPFSVTGFGGMWNTIVPSVAILVAINVAFGAIAVYTLHRASSAQVE